MRITPLPLNIMKVVNYIWKYLYEECKVRYVFMISGGGIMYLTDALLDSKIKPVCMHNEQALSMAVKAHAMLYGFSVGLITSGPGATNAITGCAEAWVDSVPCLFISGQANHTIKEYSGRQVGVQEINILDLVKPITKYCGTDFKKAIKMTTQGRHGPSWCDITLDEQKKIISHR